MTKHVTETGIPAAVDLQWIAREQRKTREEQAELHADVRLIRSQNNSLVNRVVLLESRMDVVEVGLGDVERGRELDLGRRRPRLPRRPWPLSALVVSIVLALGLLGLSLDLLLRS